MPSHGFRLGNGDKVFFDENTLNSKKSADGLISLQWYKEGEIDKIVEYCQQDVKVTRDLFEYGQKHGHIKYKTRSGVAKDLKVDWKPSSLISSS